MIICGFPLSASSFPSDQACFFKESSSVACFFAARQQLSKQPTSRSSNTNWTLSLLPAFCSAVDQKLSDENGQPHERYSPGVNLFYEKAIDTSMCNKDGSGWTRNDLTSMSVCRVTVLLCTEPLQTASLRKSFAPYSSSSLFAILQQRVSV